MMKNRKTSRALRSFRELKSVMDAGNLNLPSMNKMASGKTQPDVAHRSGSSTKQPSNPAEDQRLFEAAMADVKPVLHNKSYVKHPVASLPDSSPAATSAAVVRELTDLVTSGKGFEVSKTPEYMEGTGYGSLPHITEQLHDGNFAIQDYLDLHGCTVSAAKEIFDRFMKRAIQNDLRAVLIIHGRGLSSPDEPVLKKNVSEWLQSARWRKWLMAFASARMHDGGAGGTYVLLRSQPFKKKRNSVRFSS